MMDRVSEDYPCSIVLVEVQNGKRYLLLPPSIDPQRDHHLEFSPDGRELGFTDHGEVDVADIDLHVSPPMARPPRRLTQGNEDFFGFSWMPNSRDLIFAAIRHNTPNLWLISNVVHAAPDPLQFEGVFAQRPTLSRSKPGNRFGWLTRASSRVLICGK
jgi:hypothetical protein